VRVSAKVDYALRAMVQLAAEPGGEPVKAERLARHQDIPLRFLLGILAELRRARLLTSHRGTDGGYALSRPASQITLAEVMRVVDGPLVNVRDSRIAHLGYDGPSEPLEEVWMAVRASLRSVLEKVTIADVAHGSLPIPVRALADAYRHSSQHDPRDEWSTREPPAPGRGGSARAGPVDGPPSH
jgi:Rrf2 family protein